MPKKTTFELFLQEKHFEENPQILDDDLTDACNDWLENLQADDFIKYGEEYGDGIRKAK